MFRDASLETFPSDRNSAINTLVCNAWITLEGDPLARENLEFRLSHRIQLLLRSEGGDAWAREELKASG